MPKVSKLKENPSVVSRFQSDPTPANACRLAIADHFAAARERGSDGDDQFVRALQRAAVILEGNIPEGP